MRFYKVVILSIPVLVFGIAVHRLTRTPLQQSPPDWKNFGQLSDEEAKKAAHRSPRQFQVEVSDEEIKDFRDRLTRVRFPPAMEEEVNLTYGFPSHALPGLRDSMLSLDLHKWAVKLNTYKQYKVTIFGLDIHYVMVSGNAGLPRIPLLLVHGWPGSFYEFYSAIPLLLKKAAENGFTYDIIVPSLPGYGYSEAPYRSGCSPRYMAAMLNELMTSHLGYKQYVSQGGDWGSFVTEWIAGLYPQNLLGFHVNMCAPPGLTHDLRVLPYQIATTVLPRYFMSEEEIEISDYKGMFSQYKWLMHEGGYFHLQATKPDTVGTGISDSPLGLAVYIMEKFYTWTDDSTVTKPMKPATSDLPFTTEDVLYNVLIYWHSNSMMSSMRLYKESIGEFDVVPFESTDVPSGILFSKYEITFSPKIVAQLKYTNLKHHKVSLKGGHFAAFEMPELFSDEVVSFTKKLNY